MKSLGEKGEAPFEFFKPGSFAIDREKDQLVIYDNMKQKWMRFTLDGKFIASIDVPFTTICNFQILPSGEYVTVPVFFERQHMILQKPNTPHWFMTR